jgi:hypothetical protein
LIVENCQFPTAPGISDQRIGYSGALLRTLELRSGGVLEILDGRSGLKLLMLLRLRALRTLERFIFDAEMGDEIAVEEI